MIPPHPALRLAGKRYGADIGKTIAFGVIVACGARSSPVEVAL
ncbi:TPA: hypothetical protein QDB13_004984 [Burkholderia vietnamiensis]|nr:hypothetical protein [Burkholderia vietnamiensis]HDR9056621.1 hypothetical protein [Burkholderia vietnamiensis]HDR9198872.1 hypothetical protein [Burkholderia vietnamiensis]